jgi:hypothetical protein
VKAGFVQTKKHSKIQNSFASSENLYTIYLAVGRRIHGSQKCLEIGKEEINAYVLSSSVC